MNTTMETSASGRRWLPILVFGGFACAGLIALYLQTGWLLEARRERQILRALTANLDHLRRDNEEMQSLRGAAREVERQRKEAAEVAALRAEVAQLRRHTDELPALRAEQQRLQAERAAAVAKAGLIAEPDPFAIQKERALRIQCVSNLKQIGLAARIWANKHQEVLPPDFLTMQKELGTPRILTCPGDAARTAAESWEQFNLANISYELVSPGAAEEDPQVVLTRCTVHDNYGMVDGSAVQASATMKLITVDGKAKLGRNTP